MIKLDNVNKYYYKGKPNEIHVIDNTTVTLPNSGIVCILGPSGCGKTTLLNVIGGLDRVDSGSITIDGQRITGVSSGKVDDIRNAAIGYIFQNYNLLDNRTVFENVAIALRMTGITDEEIITSRVRYCLEKVGIDRYRNKLAGSLSGGQRQRVAIARAIVKNPGIIIADEPTGNLDSANTLEIMNIIKAISRDKLVVLVTHERSIADFYSDSIVEIRDGKIISRSENDSSRWLDYQLENKIYLKDMNTHNGFRQGNVSIDYYSDTDRQADIKLVVRDNNLYIDTGGSLTVVDEQSNIELVDEHYSAIDDTIFEDSDFDYTAHLPLEYKAKYTSMYTLFNMISSGWKAVKNFKSIKKILLLGYVFAAMFAFLAISNVLGLIEVKPADYRTTNGNYITITNSSFENTEDLMDLVESLDEVEYVLPGDTKKSVSIPLNDYLQASKAQEDVAVSIALTSALSPEDLVAGKMPVNLHDVVIDKSVIDTFLRDELGKSICLDSMDKFLGRRIRVPNLDDYRIVGISDTESPSLYVLSSQAMYILSNANETLDNISFDFLENDGEEMDPIRSGQIMDLALSKNTIKIKDGREPASEYEVILNETHKSDMELGKTTDTKLAGHRLKVVGFYTSDYADDDTFYVSEKTIMKYYISKQKNFTAYTKDTAKLKYMLDEAGVPSAVNDTRDRNTYFKVHKDQLISSIIVAAVIMLISLIEMFLMLRSSFLSRIKEIGTLRAIGLKKGDIYKMFTGEILVITCITAVPGIALMYFVLTQLVRSTFYLEGQYMLTPAVAAITFGLVMMFNLLTGLIPVFTTLRKTPAQILARTDI